MNWIELSVKTEFDAFEAISDLLTDFGANGVAIEDTSNMQNDLDLLYWDYVDENIKHQDQNVIIKAYYLENLYTEQMKLKIKDGISKIEKILKISSSEISEKVINEEDWANEWKKHYKPIKVGQSIIVKPSWEDYTKQANEIVIEMDPGMAFGTGTHESTYMCLEFIEKFIGNRKRILDIGCGSGILSITGIKLGAESAFAIDIDEVAIKVAKENALNNKIQSNIVVKKAKIQEINSGEKYDLVLANIVANVIIEISPIVKNFLDENGLFIISGIIKERQEEVQNCLKNNNYKIIETKNMGEWVAMVVACQNFS